MTDIEQPRVGRLATSANAPKGEPASRHRPFGRWNSSLDFPLMLFLVAFSGNPAFTTPNVARFIAPVAAILVGLATLLTKRPSGSRRGFLILFLFIAVIGVQAVQLSAFSIVTILGLLCRMVIAYSAVALIRDVAGTYLRVMLALAAIGLAFYLCYHAGTLLGIDLAAVTKPLALPVSTNFRSHTILLHTFFEEPPDSGRNAGIFWEPGAFAGYLNLALVFLCLIRARFSKRGYISRFCLLSVCLLTTKSTVGYIAFAAVLCMEVMARTRLNSRSKLIGYLGAALVLGLFSAAVANQSFIAPKIANSLMVATERQAGWQVDRIGTILFDLDYIAARPLTGWGMLNETRLALNPELTEGEASGRGNGLTNFAATFGVLTLLVWLASSYAALMLLASRRKVLAILGLIVLIVSLNGECFLNYPLFLMLFFSLSPGGRWMRPSAFPQPLGRTAGLRRSVPPSRTRIAT